MRKRILLPLGLSFALIGLTCFSLQAKAKAFACVVFTTSCGAGAIACGDTFGELIEDALYWDDFWCETMAPYAP